MSHYCGVWLTSTQLHVLFWTTVVWKWNYWAITVPYGDFLLTYTVYNTIYIYIDIKVSHDCFVVSSFDNDYWISHAVIVVIILIIFSSYFFFKFLIELQEYFLAKMAICYKRCPSGFSCWSVLCRAWVCILLHATPINWLSLTEWWLFVTSAVHQVSLAGLYSVELECAFYYMPRPLIDWGSQLPLLRIQHTS